MHAHDPFWWMWTTADHENKPVDSYRMAEQTNKPNHQILLALNHSLGEERISIHAELIHRRTSTDHCVQLIGANAIWRVTRFALVNLS